MNPNYNFYQQWIYNHLKARGLTESETSYMVNAISNGIKSVDDECIDNFRLSIDGDREEEYAEALACGCCGFFDETTVLKSGKVVKWGFNYGH